MRSKITQTLFRAIDELNQLRPPNDHLPKDLDAPLGGAFGRLDSAGLINLIAVTEQMATEDLGWPILLTDEGTLSQVNQVFETLGSLADYIYLQMNESKNG